MCARIPDRAAQKPGGKTRVLLDTNIWRYTVDCGEKGSLLRHARRGPYIVQIAPAVLYETLRLKDVALRASLVRLMTNTRFQRLMPEAYSESMEILREIQRVHPEWLRDPPDHQAFERLEMDWTRKSGGFWVRCARAPASEARIIDDIEGETMNRARAQSERARKEMIDAGWKSNPPMDKTFVEFPGPTPGWRGDKVEMWRTDCWSALTHALAQPDHAYRDWILPFVELDDGLLASGAWLEFGLYLTDKEALPRQWMRWAHAFAQRFRRTTPGSPADSQLATYFLDTDVVITADKALLDILEECRPYAPCRLPEGKLLAGGAQGVAELLEMLEA